MVKVVTFFLIGMMVLGLMGKLRLPKTPKLKSRKIIKAAGKCKKCGAYKIGNTPCACRDK